VANLLNGTIYVSNRSNSPIRVASFATGLENIGRAVTTFPVIRPAEPRAFVAEHAASAVNNILFDAIVETADLAGSYARNASEAVWRGDKLTIGVHLRQTQLCVITAIQTFKELGEDIGGKGRV
jgi:hypothetical protein